MEENNTIEYNRIFLKDPLYTKYEVLNWKMEDIINLLFYNEKSFVSGKTKTLDSYCPICKKPTTFVSQDTDGTMLSDVLMEAGFHSMGDGTIEKLLKELRKVGTFERVFQCPRSDNDNSHDLIFNFRLIQNDIIKIGQNPAIADLMKKDIIKYRKLDENIYQELNRSIGLASHGIGVGSLVYLRRIIEKYIVFPKIQELIIEGKITNEEFENFRFKEKIDFAKEKLPDFLTSNTKIYSILSKGIHELEEEECKHYFPILRQAIEIILDEEIEKKQREKKNKEIRDQLNKLG